MMNEELEELWHKLSLTEDELSEIVVDKNWIDEAREAWENCLVLNERVNLKTMKNVLSMIWKVSSCMVVKEVGERLFVFQFEDNMDKERVFMKQPWTINKSLLILANFDGQSKPEEVMLQWCPFWV